MAPRNRILMVEPPSNGFRQEVTHPGARGTAAVHNRKNPVSDMPDTTSTGEDAE